MLPKLLEKITPFLPWRTITDTDGTVYLRRWKILGPLWLHKFERSDHAREMHNHPWPWALSFILVNGYREMRLEVRRTLNREQQYPWSAFVLQRTVSPGCFNLLRGTTYHRVHLHQGPAWTLFLHGPRTRSWGFLNLETNKHTPYQAYLTEQGHKNLSNEFNPPLRSLW